MKTNIDSLSLIVTSNCNFDCTYCPQNRSSSKITSDTIDATIDKLLVLVKDGGYISFYGGEPLLCVDEIKYIIAEVSRIREDIRFSLTTNGSLIDGDLIDFFAKNRVELMVSYDGKTLQTNRNRSSLHHLEKVMDLLTGKSNFDFSTNSVFLEKDVKSIPNIVEELLTRGVPNVRFALDISKPWTGDSLIELEHSYIKLIDLYIGNNWQGQLVNFDQFQDSFNGEQTSCGGCKKALAVDPSGDIWGCFKFWDLSNCKPDFIDLNKYRIASVFEDKEIILKKRCDSFGNFSNLRFNQFYTSKGFCKDCEDLNLCWVCPANIALNSRFIDKVPDWLCKLKRVENRMKRLLTQRLKGLII